METSKDIVEVIQGRSDGGLDQPGDVKRSGWIWDMIGGEMTEFGD